MSKLFNITEEETNRILEMHNSRRTIQETEGELKNQYWIQIRKILESMGFKFSEYNEKGGWLSLNGFNNYMYSGKNPMNDYQHGTLTKGNVSVMYPYTEVEGGSIEPEKIRVFKKGEESPKVDNILFKKYYNSILYPQKNGEGLSGSGNYVMKVNDVQSVVGLVKDLLTNVS